MKQTKFKTLTTSCALALLLAACGGGGSGGGGGTADNTYVGTIKSFGSVTVNGVRFETDDTYFEVEDDDTADQDDLEIGQRVVIRGQVNADGMTGVAHSIEYDDNLEGIVVADLGGANIGTMNIMGMAVEINDTTVVESDVAGITSASQITAGMIVEVSGIPTADNAITATFIEVKAMDLASYTGELEIKGTIKALSSDTDPMTFAIGDLTVVYDGTTVLDDIPGGVLADGQFVEVKSMVGLNGDGHLVASEIEAEHDSANDHHDHDENDEIEFSGIITSSWSEETDSFAVNGEEIFLNEQTELEGVGRDGLTEGRTVEVEVVVENGILIAHEIEFENEDVGEERDEVEGIVTDIDVPNPGELPNVGTVTVGETTFIINNDTIMEDDLSVGEDESFNLTGLSSGDFVEILYIVDGDSLIAIKLERHDDI